MVDILGAQTEGGGGRMMKIVTYNVNGLRQRISQFGSLVKLLNSFDADIICFQETKLRRQELTTDLVMADGYESFFSCTRTTDKGRIGYSGVATFCRVKSAFSSNEVALPIAADEGFTGLVNNTKNGKNEMPTLEQGLEEFDKDELLEVDSEGRCVITDHVHFVLFNVYGPRAGTDDTERIQFKHKFFKILQKRWENLLLLGRRIIVVGDLNIAPSAMDRCDAGPDFEANEFRKWFRSMLVESGGSFYDVFRTKHPDRKEAYTCWSSSTGAEQFNYGSRIDHILCARSCLEQEHDLQGHNFVACHVHECDMLTDYKRWKPGNTPIRSWKGGLGVKLEGSDHAPVYMSLIGIPEIPQHGTPLLSSRFLPMIHGLQQTLVSVLMKRQGSTQVSSCLSSNSSLDGNVTMGRCSESVHNCSTSGLPTIESMKENSDGSILKTNEHPGNSNNETCPNTIDVLHRKKIDPSADRNKKKARKGQSSQLSLLSYFQKNPNFRNGAENSLTNMSLDSMDAPDSNRCSDESPLSDYQNSPKACDVNCSTDSKDQYEINDGCLEKDKTNSALLEWRRIQQVMQNSIPLCKGHKEPCVARVVRKAGPTFGHRFYVCARAEGPASNPEANCGFFKWASSKPQRK